MKECTDTTRGALLHAYELGLLDDPDRQDFELHLMDCESCLDRVKQFAPTASLIRHDQEIQAVVTKAVTDEESGRAKDANPGFLKRLIALPIWVRYASAASIVIIAGLSAYRLIKIQPPTSSISQTLTFNSVRSLSANTVDRSLGGDVLLKFYVGSQGVLPEYDVRVIDSNGMVIYRSPHYARLDSLGFGQISLPISQLESRVYRLRVLAVTDSLNQPLREYVFVVQ